MSILSQSSRYAFRALSLLSGPEGAYKSVEDLALHSESPAPYLAKLFHLLHQRGIVDGIRGKRGGYKLVNDANRTSLGSVVDALDGTGWRASCLLGLKGCTGNPACPARGCCQDVLRKLTQELDEHTIHDLSGVLRGMA